MKCNKKDIYLVFIYICLISLSEKRWSRGWLPFLFGYVFKINNNDCKDTHKGIEGN